MIAISILLESCHRDERAMLGICSIFLKRCPWLIQEPLATSRHPRTSAQSGGTAGTGTTVHVPTLRELNLISPPMGTAIWSVSLAETCVVLNEPE
jgi:hypothetical protein